MTRPLHASLTLLLLACGAPHPERAAASARAAPPSTPVPPAPRRETAAEPARPVAFTPSGAPRSPFQARRGEPTPGRVAEGVRRAIRTRTTELFACYRDTPCGPHGAQPSRVILALAVGTDGEIGAPRALSVTHYRWDGETLEPLAGAPTEPLARCLERALAGLRTEVPPAAPTEVRYPVAPDVTSCEGRATPSGHADR